MSISDVTNFYRIHFVGRPFELHKLIYDPNVILESDDEVNLILKQYYTFYGHQYIGNILTIICVTHNLRVKLTLGNSLTKFSICLIPLSFFFIYSHFTYWTDDLRTLIKKTRTRKLDPDNPEFKMYYQKSIDFHDSMKKRLGILKCLFEFVNYNIYKIKSYIK